MALKTNVTTNTKTNTKTKTSTNTKTQAYLFRAKVWKYKGHAGWYFVTLPKTLSKKIRRKHGSSEEGWGRLKVKAQIGRSQWATAIWYDTRAGGYLLPLKTNIRKKENIKENATIKVVIQIRHEELKYAISI